jgi:hypothetical protein
MVDESKSSSFKNDLGARNSRRKKQYEEETKGHRLFLREPEA